MSQKIVEDFQTYILCSLTFLFFQKNMTVLR